MSSNLFNVQLYLKCPVIFECLLLYLNVIIVKLGICLTSYGHSRQTVPFSRTVLDITSL